VDIGAQSGRGVVGTLEGERLSLDVVHRFENYPVTMGEGRYWDMPRLLDTTRAAISIASEQPLDSVAVDTWGVDYGLIDAAGELVTQPWSYRDERTMGSVEEVAAAHPGLDLYGDTGIQTLRINSLFQLWTQNSRSPWILESAARLLTIPDLLGYWLSGLRFNEITQGSTTQLLAADTRQWAWSVIDELGYPRRLFGELVEPGTVIGPLVGESGKTSFIATTSHDTASAVVGSVALRPGTAFISAGSWCLVGMELGQPVINERSRAADLTNELGADGSVRLLKNVIGLWLLGESRRHWQDRGIELSHEEMVAAAERVPPLRYVFDPDHSSLLTPGDVPVRIAQLLGLADELEPAVTTRAIIDSIALKFRWVIDRLASASGVEIDRVNLVGGGARNRVLCQATANATARAVIAGPDEATALGNVIVQLVGLGDVASAAEGRELAGRSIELETFEPEPGTAWEAAYAEFEDGVQGYRR
jgi:rhamnulokinase